MVRAHFAVLTAISLACSSVDAEEYRYPYHDPYVATATTAIVNADRLLPRLRRQIVYVPGLPARNQLPFLEGRGELGVALYRQHHPAPLLFILPGIGSNPYFGLATYLASLFYREGSHVVILPSPMSWNFALAASRSGAPGYAPEDARDLYTAMQRTLTVIRTRHDVKTTGINFLGVSLGALEGAYVSVIDAEQRSIGIEQYLLVNPPLDLAYALRRIDEWDALQKRFGKKRSELVLAKAVTIVESFSNDRRDDPAVFDRLAKEFAAFTTEEIQFLIAQDMRLLLPELVYVTQVIHDHNSHGRAKSRARSRLEAAKDVTFMDYRERIALPAWRRQAGEPDTDLATFTKRGSLAPILNRLRTNSRVHIMHNADDVLADIKSMRELKDVLGDQVMLYPFGGHLGNLWYANNKEDALRVLRARLERQTTAQE